MPFFPHFSSHCFAGGQLGEDGGGDGAGVCLF